MIKKFIKKLFGKPEEISFGQGFDLTGMPVITLYQGEEKYNFLLDTGSNNSVINKKVLERMEYEPIEEENQVIGSEGNPKMVDACMIRLSYKDKEFYYKYLINDLDKAFEHVKKTTGVTLHGLIGAKFFNAYKYVLDFDELIAYSKL